jgi:hypothetical protein
VGTIRAGAGMRILLYLAAVFPAGAAAGCIALAVTRRRLAWLAPAVFFASVAAVPLLYATGRAR